MKQDGETLAMLKSFEKLGTPALDCEVFHKGNCVFRYRSGYSDDARTKPVDGTERYNIYSCSKVITCTAVMQLVERDIIRLDHDRGADLQYRVREYQTRSAGNRRTDADARSDEIPGA